MQNHSKLPCKHTRKLENLNNSDWIWLENLNNSAKSLIIPSLIHTNLKNNSNKQTTTATTTKQNKKMKKGEDERLNRCWLIALQSLVFCKVWCFQSILDKNWNFNCVLTVDVCHYKTFLDIVLRYEFWCSVTFCRDIRGIRDIFCIQESFFFFMRGVFCF